MATLGGIWKFLEFGNWESGTLETPKNWLVLANFNILGIFPTQFRSQNLILNSEFQISHFSGFFLEIFWKSGNSPEFAFFTNFYVWGIISTWFQSLKLILHSEYQTSKFSGFFFWKFPGNFLEIWKFSRVCYVWPISMYGASFPLNFSHWNRICTHNIKFQHFSGTFPDMDILWKLLLWPNSTYWAWSHSICTQIFKIFWNFSRYKKGAWRHESVRGLSAGRQV